jgi:hypothetical protein
VNLKIGVFSVSLSYFINNLTAGREIMFVWWPVANKLYPGGRQSHAKIAYDCGPAVNYFFTLWQPVACKLYLSGSQSQANSRRFYSSCMQLLATWVQFACDWRPVASNFHASGQYRAKPPVFVNTLPEQLFEEENEDALKKPFRHRYWLGPISINTMYGLIQSHETGP